MLDRLATLAPRARLTAPLLITVTAVLTAATGASAVSLRLSDDSAKSAAPQAAGLRLPDAPLPAAPAPDASRQSAADVTPSLVKVPRPKHLVQATVLVTSTKPLATHTLRSLRHVSGVKQTQAVMAGKAHVDGHRAESVRGEGVERRTPDLAPGSGSVHEHHRRAIRRPGLLDEHVDVGGVNEPARPRRHTSALLRLAARRGNPESAQHQDWKGDDRRAEHHENSRELHRDSDDSSRLSGTAHYLSRLHLSYSEHT